MKYLAEIPKHILGCHIDPLISAASSIFSSSIGSSIAGAGLAAGAGALGASLAGGAGKAPAEAPAAPTPPPQANDPIGTRSGTGQRSPTSPSFVGSAAIPQQSGYGGKTLLGQ